MPLEIRELHIKATIGTEEGSPSEGNSTVELNEDIIEEIVKSCVEQVLDILKEKSER